MGRDYFSAQASGPVVVAAIRAGLFDEMPEMDGGGPGYQELAAGLRAALGEAPPRVVLDLRGAGEVNHRTVSAAVALTRTAASLGARVALCGDPFFVEIWGVCRMDQLAPAHGDIGAAVAAAAG